VQSNIWPTVKSSFSQDICKTDFTAATTETSCLSLFFGNEDDLLHSRGKPYRDLLKGSIMTNSKKLRLNVTYGLKLIVVILLLAYSIDAPVQAQSAPRPTRDWTKYPAVVEIDRPPGDIFVVSDPHAHPERLLHLLMRAGLMGLSLVRGQTIISWTGYNAVLVVTGDLIDKNPTGSLQVINLLRKLQTDAPLVGGRVIVTMGNHEAEFLSKKDKFKNKTKDFRDELTAASQTNPDLNPDRVANCEGDLGQWLCNLPLAARVGDWFFAHAGYTKGRTISQLNSDIARSFNDQPVNGFKAPEITGEKNANSILNADLDNDGPGDRPWFKDGQRDTIPEEVLRRYATALGVRHIVQGHKPGNVNFKNNLRRTRGEMFHAYGLLFLIDGDMNSHPDIDDDDNYGAALRINVEGEGVMGTSRTVNSDGTVTEPPPGPPCFKITTKAIAIKKDGSQKTFWEEIEHKRPSGEPCR
jgi:hypothetical protein